MSQIPPNDNPYASPSGGKGPFSPGSAEARQRVNAPALTLMIVAGIGIVLQAVGMMFNILGTGIGAAVAEGQQQMMRTMMSGTIGLVTGAIGLVIGGLIFYGGMQMRALQNWTLSMTASILAMIPCVSPCCLLGLPVGIWCLIVLNDAEVKRSFLS